MADVVILLSDKRSGSTMFQDELCKHPLIQTVPYSPHSNLETHWWLMAAVLLGLPDPLFSGGRAYSGYGSKRNARVQMLDLLAKCAPDYTPSSDDEKLVYDGWEALCTTLGQPVFFEKSPQFVAHWAALSLLYTWMERTKLDVKVIGLVRNPHGVMYSAARLFGTNPVTRQIGWLETCRNLIAFSQMLPKEQYQQYRYEDLAKDPVAKFEEICRFIGVEPNSSVGAGTHSSSSQKWLTDDGYRLILHNSVVQMANFLGYTDEALHNPNGVNQDVASSETQRKSIRLWFNRRRDRFLRPILMRFRQTMKTSR